MLLMSVITSKGSSQEAILRTGASEANFLRAWNASSALPITATFWRFVLYPLRRFVSGAETFEKFSMCCRLGKGLYLICCVVCRTSHSWMAYESFRGPTEMPSLLIIKPRYAISCKPNLLFFAFALELVVLQSAKDLLHVQQMLLICGRKY